MSGTPLRRVLLGCTVLALLAVSTPQLAAQRPAETITPDRPGLGDGAHVVGPGVVQLETGFEFAAGPGADVVTFGQAVIRYGVGPIEVRLLPGSFVVQTGARGIADPAVGLKVPLTRAGSRVRLSTVLTSTLTVGSEDFSAGQAVGAATLVGEVGLSGPLGLAVNAGYAFPWNDTGDGSIALMITPGLSIQSVDGLGVYAGYVGFYDDGPDTHIVETGVAYAWDADNQIDVNGGLEPDTERWFIGVGISHRWR